MSATILPEKTLHYPVLLSEVINIITPQNGGTFIDCTFGQGGYSKKILEYPNTKVIAIDRDKNSLHIASDLKMDIDNILISYISARNVLIKLDEINAESHGNLIYHQSKSLKKLYDGSNDKSDE